MNYDGTAHLVADGRPIDALLAAYAARTLGAPMAALVAAHLEIKPDNRSYVAALEAVHGVFLEELKPVPLAGRDRRLVNIFASSAAEMECAAPARTTGDGTAVLPRALRRLAGCDFGELPWRSRSSGIGEVLLARERCSTARFVRMRPGRRLPMSCREGLVAALVLVGTASDRSGYHERGDIIIASDGGEEEAALVEGSVECVCFIVSEIAAKSPSPLSRVLHLVMGD